MIYSNNVSQLIYTRKDCRLLFFFFWRWILTSAHEEHCLQQRDRPKTPLTPPTHTHTHTHTHTLPHHHQPSVARPRSGQAGSWETIPVALLTFFISERLKNIPDILLSALLLFLLFLLCLHTFRSNPSFLFFSFLFFLLFTSSETTVATEGTFTCSQRFYRLLKQSSKSFLWVKQDFVSSLVNWKWTQNSTINYFLVCMCYNNHAA